MDVKTYDAIMDELDYAMGRILNYLNEGKWSGFTLNEIDERKEKLNQTRSKAQTLTNSFRKTFVATKFGDRDFVIATPLKM